MQVEGAIFDGMGAHVNGILIEIWQADANSIYSHPVENRVDPLAQGFRGWGRVISDFDSGTWRFETVKSGVVPGGMGRLQAPHLNFWIVSRDIDIGLNTRMYFPEDADLHVHDPILSSIEHRGRFATLIAEKIRAGAVLLRAPPASRG